VEEMEEDRNLAREENFNLLRDTAQPVFIGFIAWYA